MEFLWLGGEQGRSVDRTLGRMEGIPPALEGFSQARRHGEGSDRGNWCNGEINWPTRSRMGRVEGVQ